MAFGFNELQTCLAEWPVSPLDPTASNDPLIDRIRQILLASSGGGTLAKADLQPLVRHLLLRETLSAASVAARNRQFRTPETTARASRAQLAHRIRVGRAWLVGAKRGERRLSPQRPGLASLLAGYH